MLQEGLKERWIYIDRYMRYTGIISPMIRVDGHVAPGTDRYEREGYKWMKSRGIGREEGARGKEWKERRKSGDQERKGRKGGSVEWSDRTRD